MFPSTATLEQSKAVLARSLLSLTTPHQSQCRTMDIFLFTAFYITYRLELMFTLGQILFLSDTTNFVYL